MSGDKAAEGNWRSRFINRHRLPAAYLEEAVRCYEPVARALAEQSARVIEGPLLVGVNGSQGSGKSTFCDYLREYFSEQCGLASVSLSLDDFYLSRSQRLELAHRVHPLFATRGVPGTHDIPLLHRVLDKLGAAGPGESISIPRFDKSVDDRRPPQAWDIHTGSVDIVLLEGWCLGARPQSEDELDRPVNELERTEDADGVWRHSVNRALRQDFLPLYERIDSWAMLLAPGFHCVMEWRWEQERKLARRLRPGEGQRVMDRQQLARFISFYQRLTENCLQALPAHVDFLLKLDEHRHVIECRGPEGVFQ